jgi:hypothetical protein
MHSILARSVITALCVASCAAPSLTQAGSLPDLSDVTPVFGSRTIYAEFDLKSLPAMVNLCNSTAFLEGSGYDLLWVAAVGFNATLSGYETLITAHTPLRQNCGVPIPAPLDSSLQATLFHLDPNDFVSGYSVVAGLPVTVDIAGGKILVQADRADPAFSGLSGATEAYYFTVEAARTSPDGAFSPLSVAGALGSTYPRDDAAPFNFGGGFTDPANDVCTANMACASSAHPQIDLVGGSLFPEPVVPPPTFGGNTIDVEFELSALPTMVNLCNSAAFLEGSGYDLLWVAAVGFNATLSAYETLITAHTPLRQNCGVPIPASLDSSLQATLFHLDPKDFVSGYTIVAGLPVAVDIASGKIHVQADRADPAFNGLSGATQAYYFTVETARTSPGGAFSPLDVAAGIYSTYPRDDAASFTFGGNFTDSANDVCTANMACASSTHPQIDLVGGSAHLVDYVFRDDFD